MNDAMEYSQKLKGLLEEIAGEEGAVVDYGAADAVIEANQEGGGDLFDSGFALAMKVVRMGTLSKYRWHSLKVFKAYVEVDDVTVFMIGASEEEVLARVPSFRRIG